MINYKTEAELEEIIKKFEVPKLSYLERKDAGPDEEIYFFKDEEGGGHYGIWSRDAMSELQYEKNELKNHYAIDVKQWIKTKSGDEIVDYEGDLFALFKM